jgi:uncharacterized protein YjbI with pentapeptide repeats
MIMVINGISQSIAPFSYLSGADLSGADLSYADLRWANLSGADLSGANLSGAKLYNANLSNAKLDGIVSGGLIGSPTGLPASYMLVNRYIVGPNADLSGADLRYANLSGANLSGAKLHNANLDDANLDDADLSGADLRYANLTGANLSGADLSGAKLHNAYLYDANLDDADLSGADLRYANLNGASLSGADLSGADLSGAHLNGIVSGGITGSPTGLPASYMLVNGYIVGPNANLTGADLSGADLSGADLSGADLSNADLSNADLSNANLSGADLIGIVSGGITGTPMGLPASLILVDGYITNVNDLTTISGLPTDVVAVEETAFDLDLSAVNLGDVDGNAGFAVTLTADTGTMTATSGGSVTVTGSGTGALVLTGLAADIDTFLNTASAIQYTGAQDVFGNDAATITLSANDSVEDEALGSVHVDITNVHDLTTITDLPTNVVAVEETASDLDLSAVSLGDVDGNATFAVTLTADTGTMTATSGGSVTVTGSDTGALVLTGLAADIDAFLNTASAIQYTGAQDVFGNDAATITLSANDGFGDEALGSINVTIEEYNSLIVTTEIDVVDVFDGETSLREAVAFANSNADASIITFDASLDGETVTLAGTELTLTSDITIDGDIDGDNVADITIDGDDQSGVFEISRDGIATLDGLTITGGNALYGGGILNFGTATVANSTLSGNTANYRGGGISNFGTATVTNSTLSGNSAFGGGGIYSGGSGDFATATVTNSTLSGNSAFVGGGIYSGGSGDFATATVTNSTLSGNTAGFGGGGIYNRGTATATVTNSIVLGNIAGRDAEIRGTVTNTDDLSIIGGVNVADVFAATTADGAGVLADNGGPVQTIALKNDVSNPALDAGDDAAAAAAGAETDASGSSRYDYAGVAPNGVNISDLGALELENDLTTISGLPMNVVALEETAFDLDLSAVGLGGGDGNATFALTLTADTGTMTATSGGSVTVTGSGTGALVLTGLAADIDTFLNPTSAIQYTGAQDVFGNDAATITLSANDGVTDEALGSVHVDITNVNDLTTISDLPTDIVAVEETALDLDLSAVNLGDVDGNATFAVTLTADTGTMTATSGGSVTVTGSGTDALVLTGLAADIDTFLNTASAIQYTGAQDVFGNDAATITLSATDGVTDEALGSVTVDITNVNDLTTISDLPTDVVAVEETALDLDLSAVSLGDVDGNAGFAVTLTADTGTMTATSGGSVTVTGSGTDALVLTGLAADIDAFLNTASAIQYTGAQDVFGNDAATITLSANDGVADEALGSVNVDITNVNDLTTISDVPADVVAVEETASDLDLSAVSLGDVDGNTTFAVTLTADTGTMTATSGGSVTVTGSGTDALVLTGLAADIDTFLNTASAIQYTGAQDVFGDNAATIILSANDGFGDEALGSINVSIEEDNSLIVTTEIDVVDAYDQETSLREAVDFANSNADASIITFDASLDGETVTLAGTELTLTSDITIDGDIDGDNVADITIDGDDQSRVFNISSDSIATLDALTITGGNAASGGGIYIASGSTATVTNSTLSGNTANLGGGIYNRGSATVTNSKLSGNTADRRGGGIHNNDTATVTNSTLSGNSAFGGGGIYNNATATVANSTLSGNSAFGGGGGIRNFGTATVTNSTLSGNSAFGGGGIQNYFIATVTNSTLSGNTANYRGGIYNYATATATVTNSIVLGNTSTSGDAEVSGTVTNPNDLSIIGGVNVADVFAATTANGAGVLADNGGPVQTIALKNDASNPALDAGDDAAAAAAGAETDAAGFVRNDYAGVEPNGTNISDLGALELQNDLTTISDLPTDVVAVEKTAFDLDLSAVNLGDVDGNAGFALTLTADTGTMTATSCGLVTVTGSGTGALLLTGLAADIDTFLNTASAIQYTGAQDVFGDDAATITLSANDGFGDEALGSITVDITNVNDLTTISDLPTDVVAVEETASDLDLSAVNLGDVDGNATFAVTLTADTGTMTATSGGSVTVTGSGTGALVLVGLAADIDTFLNTASAIQYTGGTDVAGDSAATITLSANDGSGDEALGSINVSIEEYNSLIVTTEIDVVDVFDGETSLREAVAFANSNADASIITFDASLDGETVTLAGTELTLTSDITINGDIDGDNVADITIDGDDQSRVFNISSDGIATLDGLTITGGNAHYGGGIYIASGSTATVTNSTLSGNTATSYGGGINIASGSTATVTNSTLSGNSAFGGGGILNAGTATVTNSTLSGNTANIRGGGILNAGTAAVTNSTLSGNTADFGGGGISNFATATVTNSTMSGNTASRSGPRLRQSLGVWSATRSTATSCPISTRRNSA